MVDVVREQSEMARDQVLLKCSHPFRMWRLPHPGSVMNPPTKTTPSPIPNQSGITKPRQIIILISKDFPMPSRMANSIQT